MVNRLNHLLVWLRRLPHSRGFGIQSPTDYQFVKYVLTEPAPYYAYDTIGKGDDWLRRKLGQLYFRIANYCQPHTIVDQIGVEEYIHAGCQKAIIAEAADTIELAFLPLQIDYQRMLGFCNEQSVVVLHGINQNRPLWHCIEYDERPVTTFDLYYCGILLFDTRRSPHNYIVNF